MTGLDAKLRESAPESSRERVSGSILWAVALAVTVDVASGQSQVASPFSFFDSDKVIHFFVFGLLGTLILRSRLVWPREGHRWWIAMAVVSLYGIVDEFRQSFTPGRSVEFDDWIADTLGAVTAVFFYLRWGAYRRLLEMPLWGRRRDLASVKTEDMEKRER